MESNMRRGGLSGKWQYLHINDLVPIIGKQRDHCIERTPARRRWRDYAIVPHHTPLQRSRRELGNISPWNRENRRVIIPWHHAHDRLPKVLQVFQGTRHRGVDRCDSLLACHTRAVAGFQKAPH